MTIYFNDMHYIEYRGKHMAEAPALQVTVSEIEVLNWLTSFP